MDFDKIKKAAKDTIKIVGGKVEEKFARSDAEEVTNAKPQSNKYDDIDDFDDVMGDTRRFDMKDALNRFKKHQSDIEDNLRDLINNNDEETSDESPVSEFIENNISDLKKDISESISDIDEDISNLSEHYSAEMTKINANIEELYNRIDAVTSIADKTNSSLNSLSENLETAVLDINKRLGEISSSLTGVNRINDSIFDLKNSQMNTKNILGDLEASFKSLKKKMTAGVAILSVISAIIAVLEVINLLS